MKDEAPGPSGPSRVPQPAVPLPLSAYLRLFEECMDAVLVCRPATGEILDANAAAARMLGWPRDELRAKLRDELVDPQDPRMPAYLRQREVAGQVIGEIALLRSDGARIEVEFTSMLCTDDGAEPIGWFLMRDITQRRALERELHELQRGLERRVLERTRELEHLNEHLEAFSASVSHDLRSPVAIVTMFSDLLLRRGLAPEDARYVGRIRDTAAHMREIIDALLRLADIGRRPLHPGQIDLHAMVDALARECTDAFGGQVRVDVVAASSLQADPAMLNVVLSNLLGNAWKFTRDANEPRVLVECLPAGADEVALRVTDNGAGFEPEHALRLFAPFQRLHRQADFPGLGIGLATVRRIVQRHGGRVVANGRPGEGASFTVILPRLGPDITHACKSCNPRDCMVGDASCPACVEWGCQPSFDSPPRYGCSTSGTLTEPSAFW